MEFVRPKTYAPPFSAHDSQWIAEELTRIGAKRVLEFGPGDSTAIIAALGIDVVSLEHEDRWFAEAKERFKDNPRVTILKFENEMPIPPVEGLEPPFDAAFVDTPQGYKKARKVHPGYEDCSRFNTCAFALNKAPVVYLHDAQRPLERGTLGRLHRFGFKHQIIGNFAKIWPTDKTSSTAPFAISES